MVTFAKPILPGVIPRIELQPDEYADDQNQAFDHDYIPVLLSQA